MFQSKFDGEKVFADWVTDEFSLPYGKLLNYVHMGYLSEYEKTKLIIVNSGRIVSIKDFENIVYDKKRLSRFDYKKWHRKIFRILNRKINWDNLPTDEEDWWFEDVELTITKEGETKIKIPEVLDEKYEKEVSRVLSHLKWEIVKRFGEPYEDKLYFEVVFDFKTKRIVDDILKTSD
ncbi:MAG: hypothetical protein HYR66_05805 [Sphingobacteriales bacterium]|nr:hypothetical protein [Sphingobacteriales bacterium]